MCIAMMHGNSPNTTLNVLERAVNNNPCHKFVIKNTTATYVAMRKTRLVAQLVVVAAEMVVEY